MKVATARTFGIIQTVQGKYQLTDLGFTSEGDLATFLRERIGRLRINTSGGQLSAGQWRRAQVAADWPVLIL